MAKVKKSSKHNTIDPTVEDVIPQPSMFRTELQKQLDRNNLVKLMKRGYSIEMVAETLGLSLNQATTDYHAVLRDFVAQREAPSEQLISLKLEEYAEIKRVAWEEWERSKNPIEKEAYATITNPDGSECHIARRFKEGRLGGSEYLNIILQCLKAEREMLGLNAAKQVKLGIGKVGEKGWDWDRFMDAMNDPNLGNEIEDRIYEGLPRINAEAEVQPLKGE